MVGTFAPLSMSMATASCVRLRLEVRVFFTPEPRAVAEMIPPALVMPFTLVAVVGSPKVTLELTRMAVAVAW